MPNTAQAVKVANDNIRPSADRIAQSYFFCKSQLALAAANDWPGLFSGLTAKEPLPDGSDVDGRTPITPEAVKALIVSMQSFVDNIDSSGLRDLVLAISVNPVR